MAKSLNIDWAKKINRKDQQIQYKTDGQTKMRSGLVGSPRPNTGITPGSTEL